MPQYLMFSVSDESESHAALVPWSEDLATTVSKRHEALKSMQEKDPGLFELCYWGVGDLYETPFTWIEEQDLMEQWEENNWMIVESNTPPWDDETIIRTSCAILHIGTRGQLHWTLWTKHGNQAYETSYLQLKDVRAAQSKVSG